MPPTPDPLPDPARPSIADGDPAWIFCWTARLGRVAPGFRDTSHNGTRIPYWPNGPGDGGTFWHRPDVSRPMDGRPGSRLAVQGSISRMACSNKGYLTGGVVVPAPDPEVRDALVAAADDAVQAERLGLWTHARVGWADGSTTDAVVVADVDVALELAEGVAAPWTIRLRGDIDEPATYSSVGGERLPSPLLVPSEGNVVIRSVDSGRLLAVRSYPVTFEHLPPPDVAHDPGPPHREGNQPTPPLLLTPRPLSGPPRSGPNAVERPARDGPPPPQPPPAAERPRRRRPPRDGSER